jgi:alkanesulfonate monooxygenase SsuD/methylene tetrahydromethanopterin reductase-like flavin-dependent oxidoreductase (luciferase family)
MKFGVLATSQPNLEVETYPYSEVHARVTREIVEADRLGYDTAWVAEHHFSHLYGVLPDPFVYLAYLAPKTERIGLGTAVMTLPLHNPVRIVENAAFVDILSEGRLSLGLGSGYRPYEFDGFGIPFDARRDIQEEAFPLILDAFHNRRIDHQGEHFQSHIGSDYEIYPASVQQPHPPFYMAAGTNRSIEAAARHGFGLMLSTLPAFDTLAEQIARYRGAMKDAPAPWNANPAFGSINIARWVYVAETDDQARAESAAGIIRHLEGFLTKKTAGYLGQISEKDSATKLDYDELVGTTLIHGSPETVIARIRALQAATGLDSLLLHYPPYYGVENTLKSLRLFAKSVIPAFRQARTGSEAAE